MRMLRFVLPKTSARAPKYSCSADATRREVADTKAGVFAYRKCRDKRVVADVVRLDKGHTEGLEPKVTEEIVKLMLSARGGKIEHGG